MSMHNLYKTKLHTNDHTKTSGIVAALIVMFLLGTGAQNAAAGGLSIEKLDLIRSQSWSASKPRDPEAFMQAIETPATVPTAVLTREDVVAKEILKRSMTLSKVQALATAQALNDEAEAAGYDPLLFLAVIQIESSYNHLAISGVGAEGLMQIMPDTAEFLATRNDLTRAENQTFDPVLNVRLGVRYLVQLDKRFHHHMDYALTAYNRGPAATAAILRNHKTLPKNIRQFYAGKVLSQYQILASRYGNLPHH